MRPLIIYGAGGHAREIAKLVRDLGAGDSGWATVAFVSDDSPGGSHGGVPVLSWREARAQASQSPGVAIAVGSPSARRRIAESLRGSDVSFPTLVHPSVSVDPTVTIGRGSMIAAGCILTVDIHIDEFVLLNRSCNVSHDCRIGPFSSLAPGTLLSGNVTVGEECDIGTGVCVAPGLEIGDGAIVGAGAAVISALPANCTAVGVPARVIKTRDS